MRVPHQRYTDESKTEVAVKGHAHGTNQHWYRKIDGVWKFAGLAPEIKWGEFDFDKVFERGRESFGDAREKMRDEVAITSGVDVKDAAQLQTEEEASPTSTPVAAVGQAPTDMEAVHTASGIGSTIENLPVEVTAKMLQNVPDTHDTLSMEGMVDA